MTARKVFVGSLPNGISDDNLRATFQQFGQIEEVFVKQGCEPGRQWAFITFASPEQAQFAKESCDRILTFPGMDRPCDVTIAKNQGMFGKQSMDRGSAAAPSGAVEGPKKIFVGSLPDGVTDSQLRAEFSRFGQVVDTYVKQGCESGRQWAFVTFSTSQEAQLAKVSTDRILVLPGSSHACEVTLARNQGQFGQDPLSGQGGAMIQMAAPAQVSQGPRKIFVGSLPDNISETVLRSEFERFGQIVDVFLKTGCEAGRQWAFVTYASPDQASLAKESTDRILVLPGSDRTCEVMLARNQGTNGADPLSGGPAMIMGG
eukprot:CAMPEP_0204530690 /NCGR_PEP_ID=MMETSP0661-20131031/10761_1 /ASSEMBLY_ACC=CAM_ASM_000606 /TAXON_ID=109239 /ORGANISM="Alexandrium margalefi, Strain AMGDE01CS-322" /LENGTH=315 /DNA_ID=CAMNT_0051536795 /DNA_START=69 /DNA_END=1013 /DNA_ORIENTATION=+